MLEQHPQHNEAIRSLIQPAAIDDERSDSDSHLSAGAVDATAIESTFETEVAEILAFLTVENAKRRRHHKAMQSVAVCFIVVMVVAFVASWSSNRHFPAGGFNFWWISMLAGGMAASKQQKRATERLAQLKDRRAVGPMADALEYRETAIKQLAADVLTELLPQIRASDEALLNPMQRQSLNTVLKNKKTDPRTIKLKCAILTAYEQVGDESALPCVVELADARSHVPMTVREAAIACLPALNERVVRAQSSRELLRGSTNDANVSNVLVRPASSNVSDPSGELLRISSQGDVPTIRE